MNFVTVRTLFFVGLLFLIPTISWAKIAVIVNPQNPVKHMSLYTVKRIYLNKIKKIPNTQIIPFPIDQMENAAIRAQFNQHVIQMDASQLRSYWAKRIFTGKGGPPKAVSTDKEVVNLVMSNTNVIGYIDGQHIPSGVKVVLKIN